MLEQRIKENCHSASAHQACSELAARKQLIEQLFRRNYSEMIRLARVLLGNDGEAEDVVQDIFLRMADSDVAPKSDAYLLTAVRNACWNRIRQMQLHERVKNLLPIEDETDLQPVDRQWERLEDISPSQTSNWRNRIAASSISLRRSLTIAEIARRLGLNPNTTYKYLAQSIQRIRNHFKH